MGAPEMIMRHPIFIRFRHFYTRCINPQSHAPQGLQGFYTFYTKEAHAGGDYAPQRGVYVCVCISV
jgi:hypothetical protein